MKNKFKELFSDKKFIGFTKWSLILMTVFIVSIILLLVANASINSAYANSFVKGVSVAGVDIGGFNYDQARTILQEKIDKVNESGFTYKTKDKAVTIYPTVTTLEDSDASYAIIYWDIDASLNQVQAFQKSQSLGALFGKVKVIFSGEDFPIFYSWDRQQHQQILSDSFSEALTEKVEASFYFDENGQIKINPEQAGQTFSYKQAIDNTENFIKNISSGEVFLNTIEDEPLVTEKDILAKKEAIIATANRGDFYLTYQEKDWNVANAVWRNWLKLVPSGNNFNIAFDKEKVGLYLEESRIKEELERPVEDARFKLQDGKVVEFTQSQAGQSIDLDNTVSIMSANLMNSGELETEIIINIVQPQVATRDVNDLGIVELLGTGVSDFTGSPPNRVHNIGVGADTLDGLLVEPGQEFSLIKALGEIDGEHGYLQELVIKGDKTIPEYGGGLCQIGTTVFRAALDTGLQISQRRNHSYRVSYYEPAGTDATIYNPWPDFRFVNDTDKHVLIQSRIEGTTLYFDFWGTSDGRVASTTYPIIYNIVAPPETKIIKTTELAPGQKRCTERAHYGADAKFDYTVEYGDDREDHEETFYSHYIPWQEVCLLGVTEEELAAENASSTPPEEE